ncbi:hypothetical protein KIN20_002482 [Parelaphostrongylus tenuis]|uniref:Uncharacterized protein n=1 Tax=Parelaphostrongylus tenuis TaxID=148309 RepID=A0AAD5LV93_PARTN|nr:hypothetical protein KIN20_002482 [Parelaphostrongylus tenuis]
MENKYGSRRRYSRNISYKSLRKSTAHMMANIRKKLSHAEQSVRRSRRAPLHPLNESRSSSPPKSTQLRIVIPQLPPHGKFLKGSFSMHCRRENKIEFHTFGLLVYGVSYGRGVCWPQIRCNDRPRSVDWRLGEITYSTTTTRRVDLDGYKFDSESNILQTPEHPQTPTTHRIRTGKRAPLLERSRLANTKAALVQIHKIQSPKVPLLASVATDMEGRSLFVKRPTAKETEDDILAMQSEWEASKSQSRHNRTAVQIHRMGKSRTSSTPGKSNSESKAVPAAPSRNFTEEESTCEQTSSARIVQPNGAPTTSCRFFIDLDKITEEWTNQVLFDVEERNSDWLEYDHSDEIARQGCRNLQYSSEDGFPDVLDLSAYYRKDADVKRTASEGKSFFAAEFDRLHGRIEDAVASVDTEAPNEEEDNYELQNDRYLASLDQEKINELRREISEKIAPDKIEFLKQRHQMKSKATEVAKPKKVSRYKASRESKHDTSQSSSVAPSVQPTTPPVVKDMLDQLEVLSEFSDRTSEEKYNRLATDAVQLDFIRKCVRNVGPRQHKSIVKLFDNCKIAPSGCTDKLIELARSRIDDIKELYLEEVKSGEETYFQFGNGLDPMVDGSWMLVPVRRVLDAIHKREKLGITETCQDDVEIIRLALLWTLMLHDEKRTAFLAFSDPNDTYVRLAEVLLIGPNVLADDVIASCYSRILTGYILKVAIDGRLRLRLESRVAGLDAFLPFFEDLLVHFEQYSLGDVADSMECRLALWSSKRNTARQMTIKMSDAADIMKHIRLLSSEQAPELEEQHYVQYTSLLGVYAASIRDGKVTRDRNPVMFAIASEELGRFVLRHSHQDSCGDESKAKEFDVLVEIIRGTLQGKLQL